MMFINAASTISYQSTFRRKGFSSVLPALDPSSEILNPDYSEFIPAMERRRMSQVQKMSIACAMDCLQQTALEHVDGIIVGTSMGCSVNIKTFLNKIVAAEKGPLSPTSFIVSTHNTVAGQIALLLKNNGYNMTYTQNSLSFEQGLIDAVMSIKEGFSHVLVGGADEEEDSIYNMKARLKNAELQLTSGASFFILSGKSLNGSVSLVDVGSFGMIENPTKVMENFLHTNQLLPNQIDLVLFASCDRDKGNELATVFGDKNIVDYLPITGTYFTSSAFAMHYAIDILCQKADQSIGDGVKNILVYNNIIAENLGLILLESVSG